MDRFVDAYENGMTPNPCIDCNRYMKFEKLYSQAKELYCDYVVTGHYARIEYDDNSKRYLLKKAVDPSKDQSYVLYSMTQDQLAHTLFPLGGMEKTATREIAAKHNFVNAKSTIVRIFALFKMDHMLNLSNNIPAKPIQKAILWIWRVIFLELIRVLSVIL